MARTILLVFLGLGVLVSGAFAADFSIKGNVSQTFDGGNNYFLSTTPLGSTLRSLTGGTLDFLAQTPTTRYLLDTNFSYYQYFGSGAAQTSPTSGMPASATFSVDHTTPLSKFNVATSWSRVDAATTQFAQSGVATGRGSIDTYNISGGVTHDLSRIDTISWTSNVATVSYTDPTQNPYLDFTTVASWKRNLNPITTLTNSVSFDWFSMDNTAKSERLFWKLMTGVQSKLSSRLAFNGDVGVIFVNSYQKNPQATAPSGPPGVAPFVPQVGTANSIVADIMLTYDLLKNVTVSLTAAQAVFPTIYGQLQKSDTVGLGINYNINHLSNLAFSTQFSHLFASSQNGPSDFLSASVIYGYQLAREWRTSLSYTYLQSNNATGLQSNNAYGVGTVEYGIISFVA